MDLIGMVTCIASMGSVISAWVHPEVPVQLDLSSMGSASSA
jgi:hypothetical protein